MKKIVFVLVFIAACALQAVCDNWRPANWVMGTEGMTSTETSISISINDNNSSYYFQSVINENAGFIFNPDYIISFNLSGFAEDFDSGDGAIALDVYSEDYRGGRFVSSYPTSNGYFEFAMSDFLGLDYLGLGSILPGDTVGIVYISPWVNSETAVAYDINRSHLDDNTVFSMTDFYYGPDLTPNESEAVPDAGTIAYGFCGFTLIFGAHIY